jgi:hypothetical protein
MAGIARRLPRRFCATCAERIDRQTAAGADVREDAIKRALPDGRCSSCKSALVFTAAELKRRTVYVVRYMDGAGIRRLATAPTRQEAEQILAERVHQSKQAAPAPAVNREIKVRDYGRRWLDIIKATGKPASHRAYEGAFRHYLESSIGDLKVRQVQQGHIRAMLARILAATASDRRSPASRGTSTSALNYATS